MTTLLAVALTVAVALPRGDAASQDSTVAFVNVSVVAVDAGRVLPSHTVIVEGGRIKWVGPARAAVVPVGARIIEGGGRFLAPGLADMHVHTEAADFPLFLANGVTTVREMNGSRQHLEWREEIRRGSRLGPGLFVAGPLLAGEAQRWRHVLLTDPKQAETEVRAEVEAGYDFVKVYDGLQPAVYMAIVGAAGAARLRVIGHIPAAVGLDWVLEHRQYEIEHTEQLLTALGGHGADTLAFPAMGVRVAGAGVWVTPTLAAFEVLSLAATPAIQARLDGPELAYVPPGIRSWWLSLRRPGGAPPAAQERGRAFFRMHQLIVAALRQTGVRLVAGTDAPNPLMVPGFALHDELRNLVTAGLPPLEVLRTATTNAAELVGAVGDFGVIAPGARADLILLDRNPLDDVANLRQLHGVMVGGRWLSRSELDSLLRQVADERKE